jgi:hypothetical protein
MAGPTSAWCEERSFGHEADAALGALRIQSGYNTVFTIGTGRSAVGFGWFLSDTIELTMKLALQVDANTDTVPGGIILSTTVGPTFNFPASGGPSNAYFVTLGAGINYEQINSLTIPGTSYATNQISAVGLAYDIEIGKRFQLLPNFSWKPNISVGGFTGTDIVNDNAGANPAFKVVPLEFALLF